nr:hypothetical protein [Tanacetum cinerariifolium]
MCLIFCISDVTAAAKTAFFKRRWTKIMRAVSGVDATVKTTEFLNKNLWDDEKRLRKLRNMEVDVGTKADQMERFIEKL